MTTAPKRRDKVPSIRAREKVRQDPAGPWLCALVLKEGGVNACARRLGWHRGGLRRLMRTAGAVLSDEYARDLARVSGDSLTSVLGLFGPRRHRRLTRTARIIAFVRSRFPRDRARIAVVDHIERERWTLQKYAAAVGVQYDALRYWLLGGLGLRSAQQQKQRRKGAIHRFLTEPLLRKLANFEHLDERVVVGLLRQAEAHHQTASAKGAKTRTGKTHPARTAEVREKMSKSRTRLWHNPEWLEKEGDRVIRNLVIRQQALRSDEGKCLAAVIRFEIGRLKGRSANPADVLLLLCRILKRQRGYFPDTSLTLEDLPGEVQVRFGRPLHSIVRAMGKPYDIGEIVALVRRFTANPQPRPFFESETEHRRWNRIKKNLGEVVWYGTFDDGTRGWRNLLDHVVETVAGAPVDMRIFRRDPGRPPASSVKPRQGTPSAD